MDYVIQSFLSEHTLYHRIERFYSICRAVLHLYTPPRIKEFVICKNRTGFCINAIWNNCKAVVFEQFRDVPHVSGRNLHICIVDGRIFLNGRFELHYHHRQPIDVNDGIRATGSFWSLHGHLVYDLDDIFVIWSIKVNQAQMEILCAAVFPNEGLTFYHTKKHTTIGTVQWWCRGVPERADDGANLRGCDALPCVFFRKKCRKIFFN